MLTAEIKLCENCLRQNEPDAVKCVYCGSKLPLTTVRMPSQPISDISRPKVRLQGSSDAIIIYIPGHETPLKIEPQKQMLIGRKDQSSESPAIDLSEFQGGVLGVSRRHALLMLTDNGMIVQDLESSNGTWLNEKRLLAKADYVVRNGDCLRLGQLFLYIYFDAHTLVEHSAKSIDEDILGTWPTSDEKLSSDAEDKTMLFSEPEEFPSIPDDPRLILSVSTANMLASYPKGIGFLAEVVLPFIRDVIELQKLVNMLLQRPLQETIVKDIAFNVDKNQYSIELIGAQDAINLLRLVNMKPQRTMGLSMQKRQLLKRSATLGIEEDQQNKTQELSDRVGMFLGRIAPQISLPMRENHLNYMVPHLEHISMSPLKLVLPTNG